MPMEDRRGIRLRVRGTVQGVGFRPWVYRLAHEIGVTGRVSNDTTGVTIEAFGPPLVLHRFRDALAATPPPAARILSIDEAEIPPEAIDGFVILPSTWAARRRVSIPADLATCSDCVAEVSSPGDRRFGYPFTNCTNCGPRFTIACDIPYDRATTTMAAFPMCERCEQEYGDPGDRRFHAEPIACPACGPQLSLLDVGGTRIDSPDVIADAAAAIAAGRIVAVKGLGGFHLACDAQSQAAVDALRVRKRRDEKPFAVMVAGLAEAERCARLSEVERRLLAGVERPIVLVTRRETSRIAGNVAPGNPLVGLLLPYTPLHHLLLASAGRPVVMTSGNLSEEPLAYQNEEAVERLRGIADLFVAHDRDIAAPCDDSVARVIADRPVLLRRSRGYVPRAVPLHRGVSRPTLACGALLKNTCCLASGDEAWLGPHVGDLDNLSTARFFEQSIDRLQRFLQIRPELIAYDLHPEYVSTTYALSRTDLPAVGVQHHHAHIVSLMAEHGLDGPVLGLAYDGTGYGLDGTAWGGELLVADNASFERAATFRPLRLAGGDVAIRQVWRIALAALLDAFDGDPPLDALRVFHDVPSTDLRVVRQLVDQKVNAPAAHGVGRYFDAFGAIVLGKREARYEGQVALDLNNAADPTDVTGAYPFEICMSRTPWEIDLRPATRAAVDDVLDGVPAARISARFHATLIEASADVVRETAAHRGRLPVALSGGCFQNPLLAAGLKRVLTDSGFEVHLHEQVPPGDGGISLGQAVVADAVSRR